MPISWYYEQYPGAKVMLAVVGGVSMPAKSGPFAPIRAPQEGRR